MNSPLVRSSTIGYFVLFLLSGGLLWGQGRLREVFGPPGWSDLAAHLLIGALMAAGVLTGSRALRGSFGWARQLEEEFSILLSPLTTADALILASTSGFVEELFFRATLQPVFGLWVTSLAFGLLHYPVNRRMIPWTVLATLLGLVFGVVYDRTGSLLAVSLAHGLINLVELMTIVRAGAAKASG